MANIKQLNGNYMGQLSEVRPAAKIFTAPDWWTVTGATCIAAYQAKGASSIAIAKINLANPGTYDLTNNIVSVPSLSSAGWIFNGLNQGFETGIFPDQNTSVAIQFSGLTGNILFGERTLWTDKFLIEHSGTGRYYEIGGENKVLPAGGLTSGNLIYSSTGKGFLNGIQEATLNTTTVGTFTAIRDLYIGAYNFISGLQYGDLTIQAFSLYSNSIPDGEISGLATRMQAL